MRRIMSLSYHCRMPAGSRIGATIDRLIEIHDGIVLALDASERPSYTRSNIEARMHMRAALRQTPRLIGEVAA